MGSGIKNDFKSTILTDLTVNNANTKVGVTLFTIFDVLSPSFTLGFVYAKFTNNCMEHKNNGWPRRALRGVISTFLLLHGMP